VQTETIRHKYILILTLQVLVNVVVIVMAMNVMILRPILVVVLVARVKFHKIEGRHEYHHYD